MATQLPVSYAHMIEGFTKGVDQTSPYYQVVYKIDNWNDADKFCNALMGFGTLSGPISGGTVTRGTPHQHPLSTNLYCRSAVVIEGLGNPVLNSNGYPNYDGGALIRAEYRPPPFDFGPLGVGNTNNQIDPSTPIAWCTQELDFGLEMHTIKYNDFKYTSGPLSGLTTGVPFSFQIPITTLTLTFHQLPYMPTTAVRNLRGRVNSTTFLGATTGTVLFKGARTSREWNTDGSVCQKVVLTFAERDAAHPWNSLPSPSGLTWYPVSDSIGTLMYRTADLTPLTQF
jgi:hypothetical protein